MRNKLKEPLQDGPTLPAIYMLTQCRPISRPSKYVAAMGHIRRLRVGQAVVLLRPEGIPEAGFRVLVESAMKNCGLKAPKGCYYRKRFDVDGNMVVMLVQRS